jgi:hypothetical protein
VYSRVVIDGDILIYKGAFSAEPTSYRIRYNDGAVEAYNTQKEAMAGYQLAGKPGSLEKIKSLKDPGLAIYYTRLALDKILSKFEGYDYTLYMTASNKDMFRYKLAKTKGYKATRKDKPHYYNLCKDWLLKQPNVKVVTDYEADDVLCIEAYQDPDILMVHVDKDIDQVPGHHYNPDKEIFYDIDEVEGMRNLHYQILFGDIADNIPGLKYWCKPRTCGEKAVRNIVDRYDDEIATQSAIYNHVSQHNDSMDLTNYNKHFQEMKDLCRLLTKEEEITIIKNKIEAEGSGQESREDESLRYQN